MTHVSEQTQHLIVSSVIGNEEAEVCISEDSGNSDQTCSTTRDDTDVLPSVLACLALTMMVVVEVGNSLSQRFDTRSWTILATGQADIDRLGTLEAALNLIVDFWSTLAQVGP